MSKTYICAATSEEIVDVPDRIRVLPIGHVVSDKGEFEVDDESFRLMKAQMEKHGVDLVIDYEHQTLQDVQAPAGGWITELEKTPDAIVAKVQWTGKAQEYLKNREYRYLSPVVLVRKSDKKAVMLHSAALTNKPAIEGMFPIVNSQSIESLLAMEPETCEKNGGKQMELKEIAKLLGLPEEATEEEVRKKLLEAGPKPEEKDKALEEKKEDMEENAEPELVANKLILGLLGLPETARTEDVAAQILSLSRSNQDGLSRMKEELKNREAEELVQKALTSGKLSAAQKDWGLEYALKDTEGFKSFLEKAPTVVPLGKLDTMEAPAKSDGVDMAVLKGMGISEEDYKKYYKQEV